MSNVRYMISEASKLIEVEQHTLRYWEEELELNIPRNEMGHRYYRDEDIEILRAVKVFKEKGYQLRAIKMLIPEIQKKNYSTPDDIDELQKEYDNKYLEAVSEECILTPEQVNENNSRDEITSINGDNTIDKLEQFKIIMQNMIKEVLEDNNGVLAEIVNEEVSNSVIKEMDYLLRVKEEREEERFKRFDRTIREVQGANREAAAGKEYKKRKKRKFFL